MTPLEHIDYSNSGESIEPKKINKNSILFSLWLLLSTIDHKMIEIEYCYFKKKMALFVDLSMGVWHSFSHFFLVSQKKISTSNEGFVLT